MPVFNVFLISKRTQLMLMTESAASFELRVDAVGDVTADLSGARYASAAARYCILSTRI
jgi:hypothetical protein